MSIIIEKIYNTPQFMDIPFIYIFLIVDKYECTMYILYNSVMPVDILHIPLRMDSNCNNILSQLLYLSLVHAWYLVLNRCSLKGMNIFKAIIDHYLPLVWYMLS